MSTFKELSGLGRATTPTGWEFVTASAADVSDEMVFVIRRGDQYAATFIGGPDLCAGRDVSDTYDVKYTFNGQLYTTYEQWKAAWTSTAEAINHFREALPPELGKWVTRTRYEEQGFEVKEHNDLAKEVNE